MTAVPRLSPPEAAPPPRSPRAGRRRRPPGAPTPLAPADAGFDDGLTLGPRSAFEPVGVTPSYAPPRAWVHPDRDRSWIGRMIPVIMTHWKLLAIGIAGSIVSLLAQVTIPAVTRSAIDSALVDRSRSLTPFIVALLVLATIRVGATWSYRATLFRMAHELEFDLRAILDEHLTRLPFSFYDRVQSGQIISRVNSDIRSVQMFLAFAPLMLMTLLTFAVAFVYMLSIHVGLTLAAVAPMPLVFVSGVRLRSTIFPMSWIIQSRLAEVATTVEENVAGVRVVKSFAAEERQLHHLAGQARRLRWASVAMQDARARWGPVTENLPRVGLAIVLLYGGLLAIDGTVTVGTLVAFNTYVLLLQAPFRMLGFFLMMSERAAASAQRIYEILDEPVHLEDHPGAVDLVDPAGAISFEDVRFNYPGIGDDRAPVLDGFSLTVEAGQTVAIVGATGSGKTTVTRLLARFYDVDAGTVRLDGQDVRRLTLRSVRAAVGAVTDEPFLFSSSAADNIAFARPDAPRDQVVAAARLAQADGFVEALPDGFDTVVGERGYTLSGGQRQRIAIARAILARPAILVLDDATSAIDVQVEAAIHDGLRGELKRQTTILIAHRLSTIALADRVVLLEGGRVVAEGTHRQLLRDEPRYSAVLARIEGDD